MAQKLKPLTKAQLEVIDTISLVILAGKIEDSSERLKGYRNKLIDDFSPKQKQIYAAIQRRSKRIMRQYVDHVESQYNAS